jgi:hypothetical protein
MPHAAVTKANGKERGTMRTLLKISIPVEQGNQAITDWDSASASAGVLGRIKPEVAYFLTMDRKRTSLIVFDLTHLLSQGQLLVDRFRRRVVIV